MPACSEAKAMMGVARYPACTLISQLLAGDRCEALAEVT